VLLAAVHVHSLLPFLNPARLIDLLGPYALIGVCAIIFAETGLLIGFVFPGDTLLIVTGLFAHHHHQVPIYLSAPAIALAAFLGGEFGYYIGRKAGPAIFERRDSGLFSRAQVDRTNRFFDRYGARAVILARFVPVVRTIAPIAAGVGRMDRRRYALYNAIGALLWGLGITLLGFVLWYIPPVRSFVEHYIDVVLLCAVAAGVLPTVVHVLRNRRAAKRADAEPSDADRTPQPQSD
jgi:membrane-associated protein